MFYLKSIATRDHISYYNNTMYKILILIILIIITAYCFIFFRKKISTDDIAYATESLTDLINSYNGY